jgi:hypothetical protein
VTDLVQVAHFRDSAVPTMIGTSTCGGVIAYANGDYAWPESEVNRFIEAGRKVHKYDVNATGWLIADVLDVERGDATIPDAPGWVDKRWASHSTAAIYIERSNVPALVTELARRPSYLIVADWTGEPHMPELELPANIVVAGVQYAENLYWDELAIYSQAWIDGARL